MKFSNQFPSVFDRFLDNDMFNWNFNNFAATNSTLPTVNIKENVDGFIVEMAAPGLVKENFKIELNNSLLTISSEVSNENKTSENERYTRREHNYQSFSRSFTLPGSVNREAISAKYENGILIVSIPKSEEAKPKPKRQIEIN